VTSRAEAETVVAIGDRSHIPVRVPNSAGQPCCCPRLR
jgi:hypothetical protein